MSVILKEIQKRQQILEEHDSKVARVDALKVELACLEKEVSATNTFELKAEIDELTDYAIQLELIDVPAPVQQEEISTVEETFEEMQQEEMPEYQQKPVTTI